MAGRKIQRLKAEALYNEEGEGRGGRKGEGKNSLGRSRSGRALPAHEAARRGQLSGRETRRERSYLSSSRGEMGLQHAPVRGDLRDGVRKLGVPLRIHSAPCKPAASSVLSTFSY
eukprot:768672-Hanusia_phi.AAC.21